MNAETLRASFNAESPLGCRAQNLVAQTSSSVVYRGREQGKSIAIKLSKFPHSARALDAFRSETERLKELRHPNILQLEHTGHIVVAEEGKAAKKIPFMTMEYASGGTVWKAAVNGRLTTEKALFHVGQVMEGMIYAHGDTPGEEVIHGDLKPGNFVIARGVTKIIDFKGGFQKMAGGISSQNPNWVLGTREYMAPERFQRKDGVSCEIYAMGVVTYELVSGNLPVSISEVTARAWEKAHRTAEIAAIKKLDRYGRVDHIADAILDPVVQAMAPDPKMRYASMAQFHHALKEAVAHGKAIARRARTSIN